LPLQLSYLSCSLFWFDSVLSQSNFITDLITLKIDFHFENPNRGKRRPRLLALFLLSRGFYSFREIQKEIYKKIEKIINPVIIYHYNDCSSSDREFCASWAFLDHFLLVLPGLLCPCQVTGLPTTNPTVIFPFLWLISVTWDLTLSFPA